MPALHWAMYNSWPDGGKEEGPIFSECLWLECPINIHQYLLEPVSFVHCFWSGFFSFTARRRALGTGFCCPGARVHVRHFYIASYRSEVIQSASFAHVLLGYFFEVMHACTRHFLTSTNLYKQARSWQSYLVSHASSGQALISFT